MNIKSFKNIYILLYVAIILWASAFVGIRISLRGYTPEALALFRYLIASLIIIPLSFKYGNFYKKLTLSEFFRIFFIGVLGFSIYNITLNYGEITTSASIASFIIGQSPIIIILSAMIFLKERINKLGWIGLATSFIGVFIIFLSKINGTHIDLGIIYVLAALLSGSLYSILQKPLLKKISGIEFAILAIWSGTFAMMIFLPQLCKEIPKASLPATASAIYLGIFPGALSYLIWSKVLEKIEASHAAGYLYLVPIFTTIIGAFVGEFPPVLSLLGGIIALSGAVMLHYGKKTAYTIVMRPGPGVDLIN